jgi:hypothetical protein
MLDAGGGTGSLAITTQPECTWEVSANVDWISSLSPASGQGTANVSFHVAANDGSSHRDGMLVVNGEQARVSQSAPCRYDVSPTGQNVAAAGGAGAPVTVSAGSTCQWTSSSNVSWIAITAGATGSGNGTVTFSVATNSGGTRTGTLTIAGRAFTVTQSASASPPPPPTCSYSISPNNLKVSASAGTGSTTVATNSTCSWTAASDATWIAVTSGASGTGDGRVAFSYTQNNDKKDRKGTLTVAGRTFTVEQDGNDSGRGDDDDNDDDDDD